MAPILGSRATEATELLATEPSAAAVQRQTTESAGSIFECNMCGYMRSEADFLAALEETMG